MKRTARLGGLAVCLALVAGTAFAARQKTTFEFFFPGVDEFGDLDFGDLGADGTVKVTYNTRSGRLRIAGRAVVENDFNRRVVITDAGVFDDFGIDGNIIRDKYTVNKRGRANYIGVARNVDIDLDEI